MDDWIVVASLTLMAGVAMPIGAATALIERIRPDWLETEFRHSVIAFGGGALFAAIGLVLVPDGIKALPIWVVALCFAGGGCTFMALDVVLALNRSPASQLTAMLADFLPEALALGATFAAGDASAGLLAGLIALQNLPEGFNAYRELSSATDMKATRIIGAFSGMALLGPVAGLTGLFWLSQYPKVVGGVMLFAAGGILYLIFQDIAPQAKLERRWAPPLGAVAGFLLGLVGKMIVE